MLPESLVSYVAEALALGCSASQVAKTLQLNGWDPNQIERALSAAEKSRPIRVVQSFEILLCLLTMLTAGVCAFVTHADTLKSEQISSVKK